jgi:hypothetical protein
MTEPGTLLPVLFRMHRGELTAYFPTEECAPGRITCYAHVGQHGSACRSLLRKGRPAKPEEYGALLAELRGIYERSIGPDDPIIPLKVYRRAPGRERRA